MSKSYPQKNDQYRPVFSATGEWEQRYETDSSDHLDLRFAHGRPDRAADAGCTYPGRHLRERCCPESVARYRICMPVGAWNGDLVVYAHGYVAFNEDVVIPRTN